MVASATDGFTLIETIIALLLSSLIMILVSTTFLVQSRYYSTQRLLASVQDNARAATDYLESELRPVMPGGIVLAGSKILTVRSPIVVGMICDRQANDVYVQFEGGAASLDTDEVAGAAVRTPPANTWTYANTSWSTINGGTSSAAANCLANGADTTGATSEFQTITQLQSLYGSAPNPGSLLMLFRETTFEIQTSQLDPSTLGLFRGAYGGSLIEFATGMDTTAQFQYRTGGTTYADTVTAVSTIDAVRIVADARLAAESGGQDDITFGWSVNVSLRNLQ